MNLHLPHLKTRSHDLHTPHTPYSSGDTLPHHCCPCLLRATLTLHDPLQPPSRLAVMIFNRLRHQESSPPTYSFSRHYQIGFMAKWKMVIGDT
ncbi:hypothetical protein M8C21_025031 [Ambrosia artemisiifolia]|uniref:Uncharacterized protein n=1 Tax=Ambrosia artemisiifolia TaxID=4212 RepID=A0AAD5DDP3_AMBAR|nr:hypothetical protein M8C21_025031 [Ambrosia artemisiifolia]